MKPTRINRHGKVLKGKAKPLPPTPAPVAVPVVKVPPIAPLPKKVPPIAPAAPVALEHYGFRVIGSPRQLTDTHMEFTTADGGTTIVQPIAHHGDFSSMKGTVRFGRLRYNEDFVADDALAPQPDDTPNKPLVAKAPKTVGPKREGVCAFIDRLIMEGTRTAEVIRDATLAEFPGRDPVATLATVRTRPSHIKAKGLTPPPFKK